MQELITLLQGTEFPKLRWRLGKAHFLLADIQATFEINVSDINQHYKMAMEEVPDNPIYVLRASEIFDGETEELRSKGVIKLKDLGYEVTDYIHWYDERWDSASKITGTIKDVDELANTRHIRKPEQNDEYLIYCYGKL